MRQRVNLLITRAFEARLQLLVFLEIAPEPLLDVLQTPGGTIEPGEEPLRAAFREANEETGLANLAHARFLGETIFEGTTETVHIHGFHLTCVEETPAIWDHCVTGTGIDDGMTFRLRWIDLPLQETLRPPFNLFLDRLTEELTG